MLPSGIVRLVSVAAPKFFALNFRSVVSLVRAQRFTVYQAIPDQNPKPTATADTLLYGELVRRRATLPHPRPRPHAPRPPPPRRRLAAPSLSRRVYRPSLSPWQRRSFYLPASLPIHVRPNSSRSVATSGELCRIFAWPRAALFIYRNKHTHVQSDCCALERFDLFSNENRARLRWSVGKNDFDSQVPPITGNAFPNIPTNLSPSPHVYGD